MATSFPKPSRSDIKALFEACSFFQSEKGVSDQAFLDAVKKHYISSHEINDGFEMYSASVHAKHKKRAPSRLNNQYHYNALVSYLTTEGYLSSDGRNISAFARCLCDFYGSHTGSRSSEDLKHLIGTYRYFQKSSWYPGYIQVSLFEVTPGPDIDRPIVTLEEQQLTGTDLPKSKGVPETIERFNGIGLARQNCIYFFMRESRKKVPKICLIYNSYEDMDENPADTLIGLTLKGSKSHLAKVHLSKIILKKVTNPKDVVSEAISESECKKKYPDVWKRILKMRIDEL